MRTAPNAFDVDLTDPWLYAGGGAHRIWQMLRAERPVAWHPVPAPGFWLITRYQDVRRVLRDHDAFSSERGILLSTLGTVDPTAGEMVAVTDPPHHRELREPLARPLDRHSVACHAGWLRDLVRETIAPAWDGGVWDAAAAFARLPVASIARLMGLPSEDVEPLLHWTYASAAPHDPHYRSGGTQATLLRAHHEIMSYLRHLISARRAAPGADLLSQVLAGAVDGRRLTDEEAVVNCYNLILGAAVTTSQPISETLIALAGQGGGEGTWPAGTPAETAVEEALRWSSPTVQFVRHARTDIELHGVRIAAGQAVCACIASANRDGTVFDRADVFEPRRTPNPHLAFGGGIHYCIGQGLARLTLRIVFEEFFDRIESWELTRAPVRLASAHVAAVVSAPLRLRLHTHPPMK
jgi:cytochrome P450